MHGRAHTVAADIQQVNHQTPLVQPVVTKAVAAHTRAGLEEPLGTHGACQQRRRQQRLDVVAGFEQIAVQFLALRQLVFVAKLMLEHLAAHLQQAAVGHGFAAKDTLAVHKGAVGGTPVADHQFVAQQRQLAVHARNFRVAQHQFARCTPTNSQGLRAQAQALGLAQLVGVNQIVHPTLTRRLQRRAAARGADQGALTVVNSFHAGVLVCGTQGVCLPWKTGAMMLLNKSALLLGPGR